MPSRLSTLAAAMAISLGAMALPASAAESIAEHAFGGVQLPEYIGPLEYMGERSRTDKRPGASYSYRAAGLSLDLAIYDYGNKGIVDGTDSAALRAEAQRVAASIEAAPGRNVRVLREGLATTGRSAQSLPLRETVFDVQSPESSDTAYVWLTAIHGLLVEARFTVAEGFEEDGVISRSEVLDALSAAIPQTAEKVEQARVAAAGTPRVDVAIQMDPATPETERPLWMNYLLTRAAHNARENEGRTPVAGEQHASFDEEVRARTVVVGMYRSLYASRGKAVSRYFEDLNRVEEAGYLREYVWRYLHQVAWTSTPPDGMNLTAFDAWSAKHLVGHVPVTHGRITLRLASK